jgi:translation initiation factor 5
MSVPMVSVDPTKREDPFYRYKMPSITCKVEGNGNGIKTVLPNIHDVCAVISRPEQILMKYFQFELGTQKTVSAKDDKFILTGSRTQETMQSKVDSFITKFVLCKHCRNPETVLTLVNNKKVTLKCKACGKTTDVNTDERCYQLFVVYLQEEEKKNPGASKEKKASDAAAAAAGPTAANEEAAAEAAGERTGETATEKSTLEDDREDPSTLLCREIQKDPEALNAHIRTVFELRTTYNIEDKHVIKLVFRGIDSSSKEPPIGKFRKHVGLLRRFTNVKDDNASEKDVAKMEAVAQGSLMSECERWATKTGPLFKLPMIVKMFFEEGAIGEAAILEWSEGKKSKSIAPELKEFMKPFVEWLKQSSQS